MIEMNVSIDGIVSRAARNELDSKVKQVILRRSDSAARRLVGRIRTDMQAAGLGRLGFALGSTSDLKRSGTVFLREGGGFSASGTVFIRSGSERSRGAIQSYTEGADILPVRGRYLWIPSDDFQRIAGVGGKGRYRLEPKLWKAQGLEAKFGPLFRIYNSKGTPLLVVKNASVSASGKARSAKNLTKRGKLRKGQVAREILIAFIGIPRTTRAARIDPLALARQEVEAMKNDIAADLNAEFT